MVEDAKSFLAGKSTNVQGRLSRQMADAAEKQDYELAAVYRDRLRALTYIQGSQTVHGQAKDPEIYPGDIVVVDGSSVKSGFKKFVQSIPLLAIFGPL